MQKGKVIKLVVCAAAFIFIDGLLHCPVLRAMPRFMEWYEASPSAVAEWKGRCTLCHINQDGRGPLNEFGQAFADHGFQFTPELVKAFPDRFAGAARTEVAASKPSVDTKQIFMQHCAACHGEDGKGTLPNAPDLTSSQWQRNVSDAQMTATIKTGKGLMPGWKDQLSEDTIAALVKYVREFGKK